MAQTKDDGGDGREWPRRTMYRGQFDMVAARQSLNEERAQLRYRLREIDEELARIEAAQQINGRL